MIYFLTPFFFIASLVCDCVRCLPARLPACRASMHRAFMLMLYITMVLRRIADFCTKHIRDLFRQTPILQQHVKTCVDENMKQIEIDTNKLKADVNKLKMQINVLTMEKCYMESYINDLQPIGEPFRLPRFDTLESYMPNLTDPCPTPAMQPPPPGVVLAIPIVSAVDWDVCPAPPRLRRGDYTR